MPPPGNTSPNRDKRFVSYPLDGDHADFAWTPNGAFRRPTTYATRASRFEWIDRGRKTTAELPTRPLPAATGPGWKRWLDVSATMISLPFTLPLVAGIVIWIKLVSRGPVLLRQTRIGQNGRPFVLLKFRSLKPNSPTDRHESYVKHLVASESPMVKLDFLRDTRLIAGGALLRAAGLDELPQLCNVLRGEMSLVGPRPCLPTEYALYSRRQRRRFKAQPGITGLWQVLGRNRATFREMNIMDIYYIRHLSMGLDLSIIIRTPSALLSQLALALQHQYSTIQTPEDKPSNHPADP